jgi:hypothetical protein
MALVNRLEKRCVTGGSSYSPELAGEKRLSFFRLAQQGAQTPPVYYRALTKPRPGW